MVVEIQHHGNQMFANDKDMPKPTYWDKPKKFKSLQDHPTTFPQEVEIIQTKLNTLERTSSNQSTRKQNNKKNSKQNLLEV